jgi:shikimate kinase
MNRVKLAGSKAVVLGGGGAARAAAYSLVSAGAAVTVANRTVKKAEAIAEALGCGFCPLEGEQLEKVFAGADIVVSTLSTSERAIAPELLRKDMAVLDAVYAHRTAIFSDAVSKGCNAIRGNEWLFCQGMETFEVFTGRKANVQVMEKAVADELASMGRKKSIALIGFMASGKTCTAKKLAALSGMKMIEIDYEVEKAADMKIAEIFGKKGERHFRKLESSEIAKCAGRKKTVISCGGGAVLDPRNVKVLRENCIVVWLWASPDEIIRRVGADSSRPLLNVKDRGKKVKAMLAARLESYACCADIIVGTEGEKPEEVARLILDEIGKTFED